MGHVVELNRRDHVEQTHTEQVDAHNYIHIVIYGNINNDGVVNEVSIKSNRVIKVPPVERSVDDKR
jgi:hypothetical protein